MDKQLAKSRPWLRFFSAEASSGSGDAGDTTDQQANGSTDSTADNSRESSSGEQQEGSSDGEENSEDDGEDPNARGSKRQVLADLANERDKRQDAEAARDELQTERDELNKKLEEITRERDELKQAAEHKAAEEARQALINKALKEAKLPAEMADRLRGETEEELIADAQQLSKIVGFDRSATDPSQGQGSTPKPSNLQDAIRARYEKR